MKTSSQRILTTHVGSLPRPNALFELLLAQDSGNDGNTEGGQARLDQAVVDAVNAAVKQQVAVGIDIIGDGEMGKSSYTHYVKHRLSGIVSAKMNDPGTPRLGPLDMRDHPDLLAANQQGRGTARNLFAPLACEGPITYIGHAQVKQDVESLRRAATEARATGDLFLTSASPGTLAHFIRDRHYKSDAFLAALAEAMRVEYEFIAASGMVLQIDCPDLAMTRHINFQALSDGEFLKVAQCNVEALNHATRNIPAESMRMHVCWGNYPGPHTRDMPVAKLFDVMMRAKPQAVLFEAANPRHAHEWEDWRTARIPDDKILVPGAIDSTTNFVEHPRRVAQILRHYIDIVGRERVIAGTDCGFGTVAGRDVVAPSVVYAKLASLAEGARLASSRKSA